MAEFLFNENGYNDLKLVYKSFVSMSQSVIMFTKNKLSCCFFLFMRYNSPSNGPWLI